MFKKCTAILVAIVMVSGLIPTRISAETSGFVQPAFRLTDDGFQYNICENDDGTNFVVIDGYSGNATAIEIPAEIDGIPVIGIDYMAFYDDPLTSVILPDSISRIEELAFADCNQLTSIRMPKRLEFMGEYVFWSCSSLESIIIPEGVTTIDSSMFEYCFSLKKVTVPASVTYFRLGGVVPLTAVEEVVISEDNPAYCAIDNVVFNKAMTEIIFYPATKEGAYTIPDTVTQLYAYDFWGCAGLTAVTIPASVTNIAAAFVSCGNLREITFVGDAPTFNSNAFVDVEATVYYPANNPTWTADVMQNYDGTITWVGYHIFDDVSSENYYFAPVVWASTEGITSGTTPTEFSPYDSCLRSQVVTFLWRAAGEPKAKTAVNPFVDVKPSDYYYDAVLWAVEQGITTGADATHFEPNGVCNRSQVVTFLYRAFEQPPVGSAENPFTDVSNGDWYASAVLWAVQEGITNGLSKTSFGPNDLCNRSQVVTFLHRAYVN